MNDFISQLEAELKILGFLYGSQQASAPQEEMAAPALLLSPHFLSPRHPNPLLRRPIPPTTQNQASNPRLRRVEAAGGGCESKLKNSEAGVLDLWLERRLWEFEENFEGSVPSFEPVRCTLGPRGECGGEDGAGGVREK